MNPRDKNDYGRAWRRVEEHAEEEEDERLANRSVDEHRAVLKEKGIAPADDWSPGDIMAKVAARAEKEAAPPSPATSAASPPGPPGPAPATPKIAPVVPLRRPWKFLALYAAACAVLFLIVKTAEPPELVGSAPTDREIAEGDRDVAEASCALKDWAGCKEDLDEAAKLDPAGESEPRVQKARAAIAAGMAVHPPDAGRIP
jgi:hypothetical protein